MCPECGMALVPRAPGPAHAHGENGEFNKHAGHSTASFIRKFWVALLLTVPILAYSELPEMFLGWSAPAFPGMELLTLLLGSVVFFYCGWIFLASAWREIRARLPGMMTLIALAISAAYLYSVYATLAGTGHTLWWELSTLIAVMLIGHWIEMRAVQGAQGALKELSRLLPDTAEVVRGGKTMSIPLFELAENDIAVVRPGGRIPADGVVVEGSSEVNEAMVTGESAPLAKRESSEVIAGTVNGDGALSIRVSKIGEHTFLAGVMRLVEEAQASKSRLQMLSDRAAFYLTLVAILAGAVTLAAWLFAGYGLSIAIERLVAVLVIACPHALGLAIPLVASISTTLAARNGFLIKQRLALEAARNVGVVLFDKTGTLTSGEYGVADMWVAEVKDEDELLRVAASVDARSEHFISKAIVKKAQERNIQLADVTDFSRIAGKGVKAMLDGAVVYVGGAGILDDAGAAVPEDIRNAAETEGRKGKTLIYAVSGGKLLGVFALADLIREESREAVSGLKALGIKVAMITGDSDHVAAWVAKELGIDEYFARVMPDKKSEKVKLLQSQGMKVAMVGDGINDAPALTQADVGIAIGAGTNVAIESAGIILVRNDPRDIARIIKLSKLTYSKMLQNLFWATGYNLAALPIAAGALAAYGIILQPAVAAVFMSLSTVIVSINAVLLRRARL